MLGRTGMIVFWLTLLLTHERSLALCPGMCICDDESLKSSCQDAGLDVVPIQLNPNLKVINLRGNKITSVRDTICIYTNLRILDISQNKITTLGSQNFELHAELMILNISNNQITVLERKTFGGLISLRTLDISNNFLDNIEGSIFLELTNLEHLNLSKNHITVIGKGVFDNLKSLRTLQLDGNQLLDVPTHVLRNLQLLQVLALDDNLIEVVSEDSFPLLRDLKVLTLESNVISDIHLTAFDNVKMLEFLDLGNNNISLVPTAQLSKLTELRELRVCGNEFSIIGPVAFQNLVDLRSLWICQLLHLKHVDVRAFVDNIKLETLIMDGNINLETLPIRLFHSNPLLTHLSVRGTSLTSLDASHFPLDQLHYLYLGGNSLRCNCSMLWLWLLARKQRGIMSNNFTAISTVIPDNMPRLDIDELQCQNLNTGEKTLLVDVPESVVICEATWLIVLLVTTGVVISLLSISCTVMFSLGCGKWCKKREKEPEETETEIPTRSLHNTTATHHHNHSLYNNRRQTGKLLRFVPKRPDMEGMDEIVLKHSKCVDRDFHIQGPLANWETFPGENRVHDHRRPQMYTPHYNADARIKKPAHIVYV
ncbi:leucine-rich repeat neuronal protein 3-like [Bacillus rossius redtenbacheri]|uniref:leucine-rich repeat neuronal protein 3-like n=1 Tax=Bacillus rossius redtenbacheri TaxID=93214 RepID=UPI002FDD4D3E